MDLKAMGARLQTARKAAGLTQQAAATKVGIDLSSLSRYERGLVDDVSIRTISELAGLYGTRLDWIVKGEGPSRLELVTERDEEENEALRVFLASFEPDDPQRPTDAEAQRLRGLSFRELRLGGLGITPSLYGRVLREMRLQDAGRISRGQTAEVEAPEDTLDLPEPPKRGRGR